MLDKNKEDAAPSSKSQKEHRRAQVRKAQMWVESPAQVEETSCTFSKSAPESIVNEKKTMSNI